jgi:hypothetical protein
MGIMREIGSGTYSTQVEQLSTLVKRAFIRAQNPAIDISISYSGDTWSNQFRMSSMDVLLDYENPFKMGEEHDDSTDGQFLAKPVLSIATQRQKLLGQRMVIPATLTVLVNKHPEGRLMIDGFTQLVSYILDKEEFGWLWLEFSLLPLNITVNRVLDGRELTPELGNRVLLCPIQCDFSFLGD